MRTARLAAMVVISVVAIGIRTTSTATALPEYNTTKVKLTATTGGVKVVWNNGSETINCTKSVFEGGEIVTKFLVGPLRVHFLECESRGSSGEGCTAKSVGAGEGLILTNTIHSFLVLQQLSTGAHVTWWLLLPVAGSIFTTLNSNKCTKGGTLIGQLGSEVAPLKRSQATEKLLFTAAGEGKAVGEEFEGGEIGTHEYRGLSFFTESVTVEAEASVIFAKAVEVT
jgi:hypothetical protein